MRAIDLFSGCGGLSLGFQNAGFDIAVAFDNWQPAIEIYQANFEHPIITMDLSNIQDYRIFQSYVPDVIMGGPPCQDFSSAGKRNESVRADLTVSFAQIIENVRPQIFVMENVERITTTRTLAKIIEIFRMCGYGLTAQVLNASLCGVPQLRKRYFLIGILDEEDDVLVPYLNNNLSESPMSIFDYLGNGLGLEHYYRHPRSYARRGIFSIYEPSPTIRGVNRPIPKTYQFHEGDTDKNIANLRALTSIERSYIQTFPENFYWVLKVKSDLEQAIGNAVPVKLAEYVASAIQSYLTDKIIGEVKTKNQSTNTTQLSIFA